MSVDELRTLLAGPGPCVALTGAGVSTESGIPDFRSPTGIWAGYDPAEVASIDGFRRDPARVWDFYGRRLELLAGVEPNPAHRALAELERRGHVSALITQNVDGLHARAGSRTVLELHGSIRGATCLRCGTRLDHAAVVAGLPLPTCPACGAVPKPNVVMFGELLDPALLERATGLARDARLLLVVGSSLQVWPAAGLPLETLAGGGRLAIVNREPTAMDDRAVVVVHAAAGATLAALV